MVAELAVDCEGILGSGTFGSKNKSGCDGISFTNVASKERGTNERDKSARGHNSMWQVRGVEAG